MRLASARFFWLALLLCTMTGGGAFFPWLGWLAAAGLAALTLAIGVDWWSLPGLTQLQVVRQVGERLSVGEAATVTLEMYNRSARTLSARLTDTPPQPFVGPRLTRFELTVPGRRTARTSYQVVAPSRGSFAFARLYLRLSGPLGLGLRHFELDQPQKVRVFPRLLGSRRFELLQQRVLRQLGLRRHRLPGEGTEFEHLREYNPNDDVRWIDWNATARAGRPIARGYRTERHQTVMVVLDAGRLMGARIACPQGPELTKLDYCLEAACALAYMALKQADQVGAMVLADSVLAFVGPRSGPGHMERLLEALHAVQVRRSETHFEQGLGHLRSYQRRRSLVVLLTDIQDRASARRLVTQVAMLRPTHLPLILTVRDQQLNQLASQVPQAPSELYQVGVACELLSQREQVLAELRALGALTLDCPAQELSFQAVSAYLDIKLRNRL